MEEIQQTLQDITNALKASALMSGILLSIFCLLMVGVMVITTCDEIKERREKRKQKPAGKQPTDNNKKSPSEDGENSSPIDKPLKEESDNDNHSGD